MLIKTINESPLSLKESPVSENGYGYLCFDPCLCPSSSWAAPTSHFKPNFLQSLGWVCSFPPSRLHKLFALAARFPGPFYLNNWQTPLHCSGSNCRRLSPRCLHSSGLLLPLPAQMSPFQQALPHRHLTHSHAPSSGELGLFIPSITSSWIITSVRIVVSACLCPSPASPPTTLDVHENRDSAESVTDECSVPRLST